MKNPAKRKYTTITIPSTLFEKLQANIKDTGGFSSVSDYVTYILRETLAEINTHKSKSSSKVEGAVMSKLRALGYIQ